MNIQLSDMFCVLFSAKSIALNLSANSDVPHNLEEIAIHRAVAWRQGNEVATHTPPLPGWPKMLVIEFSYMEKC